MRPKFRRLFLANLWLTGLLLLFQFFLRSSSVARSGDWIGLTLGIVSTVLMVGAAALAWRKRHKRIAWLGRTQYWLQFHVYGGWLGVLLALMHAGLGLPHGPLNWLLWLLTLWVGVTGLVGVVLQKWIPSLLSSGLRLEVVYERIEEHVNNLLQEAEGIAKAASVEVQNFYAKELRPFLSRPMPRLAFALDITGGFNKRLSLFEYVASNLSGEDKDRVEDLKVIAQEKNELDAHCSLQRLLRRWVLWHVAPSWVLLLAIAAHIYVVLVY